MSYPPNFLTYKRGSQKAGLGETQMSVESRWGSLLSGVYPVILNKILLDKIKYVYYLFHT